MVTRQLGKILRSFIHFLLNNGFLYKCKINYFHCSPGMSMNWTLIVTLSFSGAAAVKVTYKNQQKPVLTVREGIQERNRVIRPIKMPSRPKNLRNF